MPPFQTEVRIRFHHMDRAGMVFHGAYTAFFQDAFEDLMAAAGHVEKDLEPTLGVRLPVVHHEMDFPAPPQDDALTIEVVLERIGETSATFLMTARDAQGTTAATARVVRVCIGEPGRPHELPPELRAAWQPFLAEPDDL